MNTKFNTNQPTLLCLVALAGLGLSAQISTAEIYKQVQPDGTVTFTDQPVEGQAKEKVKIPPTATIPSINADAILLKDAKQKPKSVEYSITIQSPAAGTTYRNAEADAIPLRYTLKPTLSSNHSVELSINGVSINSNSPQLPAQYRGEHTLVLKVVNKDGKILGQTSAKFFVQKFSAALNESEHFVSINSNYSNILKETTRAIRANTSPPAPSNSQKITVLNPG